MNQPSIPSPRPITLDELIALEPRIADLLAYCEHCADGLDHFCAEDQFYGYSQRSVCIKAAVIELVGSEAPTSSHPALRTSRAYDLVYEAAASRMPSCRGCWCGQT